MYSEEAMELAFQYSLSLLQVPTNYYKTVNEIYADALLNSLNISRFRDLYSVLSHE